MSTPVSVEHALTEWLVGPGNGSKELLYAIDKTISQGLFPQADVMQAVKHLKSTVLDGQPIRWYNQVISKLSSLPDLKMATAVLCLHAGNLPLVGFQDVLAVLLSGRPYAGKLSRKDPWLIQSFLDVYQRVDPATQVRASTSLKDFTNAGFDTWMFAGSESGLSEVESLLNSYNIITSQSRSLRRTAHFSVVLLDGDSEQELIDLCEAMFRYGGRGCRSAAIVYSNKSLSDIRNELLVHAEQWFRGNEYPSEVPVAVLYRNAYNKVAGIESLLVGSHLIQQGLPSPDHPQIIYWQPEIDYRSLRATFGSDLQEIYGSSQHNLTPLSQAQRPPIDWKPDGKDTLEWLLTIFF
jgi:hypothetical protein